MNRESNDFDKPARPRSSMRPDSRYDGNGDDRRHDYENPTSAGMIGFILSMVSLGLGIVVAVLWFAMNAEEVVRPNVDRYRTMLYLFMLFDVISFFVALAATIFAGRGLSPTNPLYRGWAMTALILGICEMILTAIAVLFLSCCVLIAEVNRAGG